MVKRYQPYLVFIESLFWHDNTAQMISNYAVKYPKMVVTVFSYIPLSPQKIRTFAKVGVQNFVDSREDDDKILAACTKICNGKIVQPDWLSNDDGLASYGPERTILTKTEKQVLRLYGLGDSPKDIAFKRNTTRGTAQNQLSEIRKKLGLSKNELRNYALKSGFVFADEIVNPAIHYTKLEEEARAILAEV
ncbi:hypothetical protein LQZ19_16545 [Treponema primitia]|uniref:helix-turn-helix transcriptional regulator n=1 Tax=Treponema primitia TaxID=88058 RepID=UPI00397EAC60